ncbi:C3a anaphylatoxin chemotactic receptor-like isoform X2 [Erpetoichthys calabaricus]|uniref:C3a anaphylatoxin chemotactic receptor-like isoform X2 n=1 Tax=Erpetoichthys calabaricus TaxID=27687 RepID=UPI0022348C3E|nr:C3a anaphylatoxin chemotactic receptor-like isoform X2 [Erpetoichthys calabaricus]
MVTTAMDDHPTYGTTPEMEYYDYVDTSVTPATSLALYSVTFLLGTVGNGLVIWVISCRMRKTANSVWFLNLAIADFAFCCTLPFSIVYTALGYSWPFGNVMCKMTSAISVSTMYSSIYMLAAISFDRCLNVIAAVWARNHWTVWKATVTCLIIWVLSVMLSIPYIYFRGQEHVENVTVCFYNVTIHQHFALTVSRFMLGFLIPIIFIISCYSIIAFRFCTFKHKSSYRPFRVIVAVILVFIVCWTPFHIFQMLELKLHQHSKDITQIQMIQRGISISTNIAFFNSCLNPILYVCMCKDFQKKARESILKILESAFRDELSQSWMSSRRSTTQSECAGLEQRKNSTAVTDVFLVSTV